MNYSIEITSYFRKQIKKLNKKYPSLKKEFRQLIIDLQQEPKLGKGIGNQCYKIRIAIASKGKGKSSGGRVITYVITEEKKIYLIYIYDKSDKENITDKELLELLKNLKNS